VGKVKATAVVRAADMTQETVMAGGVVVVRKRPPTAWGSEMYMGSGTVMDQEGGDGEGSGDGWGDGYGAGSAVGTKGWGLGYGWAKGSGSGGGYGDG